MDILKRIFRLVRRIGILVSLVSVMEDTTLLPIYTGSYFRKTVELFIIRKTRGLRLN